MPADVWSGLAETFCVGNGHHELPLSAITVGAALRRTVRGLLILFWLLGTRVLSRRTRISS